MKPILLPLFLVPILAGQPVAPEFVNPVKKLLNAGGMVVGGTIQAANPDTAAIMANAGFDFLWIEGEHSPITLETTRNIILLTHGRKAVPFTRVPVNELWTAKRMLDIGSLGVIFPFTDSAALARQAVAACKYPPAGLRGVGPGMAALRWPAPEGYPKWANDNAMVIVIVERPVAIEHIEEIAAVPGIDVLFIGANDLSYSYGKRGNQEDPEVKEAIAKILATGKKYGIPVGRPSGSPEQIAEFVKDAKVDQDEFAEYSELTRRLGFEYNGMVLHEYYFDNLKTGGGSGDPDRTSEFRAATEQSFGSYETWKAEFVGIGKMRGVGWAICYENPANGRLSNHWITLHETGNVAGFHPVLVMDVWEHAYILDYKPADRPKYIEAFFSNIDWSAVNKRLRTRKAQPRAA